MEMIIFTDKTSTPTENVLVSVPDNIYSNRRIFRNLVNNKYPHATKKQSHSIAK